MKTLLLVLCLFATTAFAQDWRGGGGGGGGQRPGGPNNGQPPPAQPLPENYVLTLTVSDGGQVAAELSLVIATTDFSASLPDAKTAVNGFNGTVNLEENGGAVVRYTLNVEILIRPYGPNTQTKNSVTQSSVRLRLGEPVQILKADTRTYQLKLEKMADRPAAENGS